MASMLIPYAVKNGNFVHVSTVERGLARGCVPLVPKLLLGNADALNENLIRTKKLCTPKRSLGTREKIIFFVAMAVITFLSVNAVAKESNIIKVTLFDNARNREVPVLIYEPKFGGNRVTTCPVAIISSGYGESNSSYSFIAQPLVDMGYLVVSIQHDLESDETLPVEGNIFELRAPFWVRGAENIEFTMRALSLKYQKYNWLHPVLIGHSNGGDISVWFTKLHTTTPAALITLDHRRVPLPRSNVPHILTLRGTDFPADNGVLPTPEEQNSFGITVITINGALHNEMIDSGPSKIKQRIVKELNKFLIGLDL